jgi:hypothetical protein
MLYSELGNYGFLEIRRKELISINYKLPKYTVELEIFIDYSYYYL